MTRYAPAPNGDDQAHCAELARHFKAEFVPDWRAVTEDPSVSAVLIFGAPAGRLEVLISALRAGKVVLCPFPAAPDATSLRAVSEARAEGGGILLMLGEIAGTAAGAHMLDALRSERLGVPHSIWAAIRSRRSTIPAQDVIEQHGWPVLDFLLTAISETPARVHATLAHLFESGPHPDTAVILLRFERPLIATIELSRCLPASMAVPPSGELEIEVIGSRGVVRIEPYNTTVRVYSDTGVSARPWVDGAVVRTLPQVIAAVESRTGDLSLRRNELAVPIMERIRSPR
jgi:predicted dehydrogenase